MRKTFDFVCVCLSVCLCVLFVYVCHCLSGPSVLLSVCRSRFILLIRISVSSILTQDCVPASSPCSIFLVILLLLLLFSILGSSSVELPLLTWTHMIYSS